MKTLYPNITKFMRVPCGKCVDCLQKYVQSWSTRLQLEMMTSRETLFVTLTYDDEHLPSDMSVDKETIQKFFKRLRKNFNLSNFKYYLISEYGPHGHRPHYHGVFYNVTAEQVSETWHNGFVTIGEPEMPRLVYVCKYHILKNEFVPEGCKPNFKLMSRGLGLCGFEQYRLSDAQLNEWKFIFNESNFMSPIHRYFKTKYDIKSDYKDIKPLFKRGLDINYLKGYQKAVEHKTQHYIKQCMINKQF